MLLWLRLTFQVKPKSNKGNIRKAKVRPLYYGIEPRIKGYILSLIIDTPRNLSVELNDDIFHNLHLFANLVYSFVMDIKD